MNKPIKIYQEYFKRSRPGESPVIWKGREFKGKLTSPILIRIDPVLKDNPNLEKALVRHEVNEIKEIIKGKSDKEAHRIAHQKEPELTCNMSLSQFWRSARRWRISPRTPRITPKMPRLR